MLSIPTGARTSQSAVVDHTNMVSFLGLDGARVLGTPYLILMLEMTARDTILQFLEPGFDSVGTVVNIQHLAATPVGMRVTCHAEIIEVQDRRVLCRVEAFDEKEKVAEGVHERFVINVERFAARLAAKQNAS
jgi:predicted thioesterase